MIYLASPYSHPDPAVKQQRFDAACKAAGKLMIDGECVFSPIAHSHSIEAQMFIPQDHQFWMRQDIAILKHCDSLYVLNIEGWKESKGVAEEISVARANNMRIILYSPDTDNYTFL